MDPTIGAALIGGASSLGGSLWSGSQSAKQASANRKHYLRMSNTAHQRQVKDLAAAGLNPILSAYGSGAAAGGTVQPNMPDMGASIARGMASGAMVSSARANTALTRQQTRQAEVAAKMDKGMFQFLRKNKHFRSLIYASKLASSAGLPPQLFGPLLGLSSSSAFDQVMKLLQAAKGDKPGTAADKRLTGKMLEIGIDPETGDFMTGSNSSSAFDKFIKELRFREDLYEINREHDRKVRRGKKRKERR